MLHQISLYLAEQWELRTVTPWPLFKDTQRISCHSPWLLSWVCATCVPLLPACSWTYGSGPCFCMSWWNSVLANSLQFQTASKPVICVCLFASGFYPKMTALKNVTSYEVSCNLGCFFQNFLLSSYLYSAVLQSVITIRVGSADPCLSFYKIGQKLDEIWTPLWVVWLSQIKLFFSALWSEESYKYIRKKLLRNVMTPSMILSRKEYYDILRKCKSH